MSTIKRGILLLLIILLLSRSDYSPGEPLEGVRTFTRQIEFDYVSWTLQAFSVKLNQAVVRADRFLPVDTRPKTVMQYLDMLRKIQQIEAQIREMYANPNIPKPLEATQALSQELAELQKKRLWLEPLAESIVQNQISQILVDLNLAWGGQPLPAVLYHTTPPPYALIISPRDTIRQDMSISVSPELTLEEQVGLETRVDQALGVSSLVVGIGGIGLYPTMVMQTTDINWLVDVVAHEWVHNYLTLRPLGMLYMNSPELRTMNETAASLAGKEIGQEVIQRFYPEHLPPPSPEVAPSPAPEKPASPPVFDFRAEMHTTRLAVDQMLSEGKIVEAEDYMEMRRRYFWENGYQIRKINQAYFAFYGAYADEPGGAAGSDPVGAAVRKLRATSSSLAKFLNRIAWVTSYEQLDKIVSADS